MNKILWLVNPATFSEKDLSFPSYLIKMGTNKVYVLLLSEWETGAVPIMINDPVFPTTNYTIPDSEIASEDFRREDEVRERIRNAALKSGVEIVINSGPVDAGAGVIEESRFADLVLVSAGLSFHEFSGETPSKYVMDLMPKMQCPVLIIPDDDQEIREIYFSYNGSYSSMYAIRQMVYLFPAFKRLPVTVLYVEEGKGEIPFEKSLKEFLYNHFENITIKLLKGDPASALMGELMYKKNVLVTFGAFGRNKLSRFFKHSNAEGVLQVIDIPAFITHP